MFQCPVTVSSSLTSSSASPVSGLLSSATATPGSTTSGGTTTAHHQAPQQPHHPLGVRMAVTSAVVRPPGGSPTAVASVIPASQTSGGPPTASQPASSGPTPGRCCDTGRPIFTDPLTGQTVCSCQYDSAARLALGAYPRSYSSYPTPTPSGSDQGPYPSIGMDSSAFYSPLVSCRSFFLSVLLCWIDFGRIRKALSS